MSAFLMNEESTSDLAYNIFTKGSGHEKIAEYFEKNDITCPEDLFKKLRWDNIRSLNARYDAKKTKKDIGEYHFRKNDLSLVELIKKINCWQYQSCEDDRVTNGKLFKSLSEFAKDAAMKYVMKSEEYRDAKWE